MMPLAALRRLLHIPVMCGRYGFGNPARLGTLPFGAPLPALEEHYNVAPSSLVPLVRERPKGRDAMLASWGLVPSWASDPSIGHRLINARDDSLETKPAFRDSYRQRRALMPADLFYEWQVVDGRKGRQPWCVRQPDAEPFAFGALWERWKPRGQSAGEWLITCVIITTEPNELLATIHDRMPLIIAPEDYDAWLHPATSPDVVEKLVRPWSGPLEAWPVGMRVNSPQNDDAECIEPLA
jgi:putative SOS response-associated peptidase YedK